MQCADPLPVYNQQQAVDSDPAVSAESATVPATISRAAGAEFLNDCILPNGYGYVKLPIRVTVQGGRVIPTMYYQQNVTGGQWCKFSVRSQPRNV